MNAENFTLKRFALEIRYPDGFLYWDRCGQFWKQFVMNFPDLSMKVVSTESAEGLLKDSHISLRLGPGNAATTADFPISKKKLYEVTDQFNQLVIHTLEIKEYTRVGCRLFFESMCKSEIVFKLLQKAQLVPSNVPSTDKQKALKEVQLAIRTEEEGIGSIIRVITFDRKLEIQGLPSAVTVKDTGFSGQGLLVDVDRYTTVTTDVGKILCSNFMDATYKKAVDLLEAMFNLKVLEEQ